jgi:uncharacterized protein DUF4229
VKTFLLYTLARLVLFGAVFGLIWLIFGRWLEWRTASALYTALIAMVISSFVALLVLGSLRNEFAIQVAKRADRAVAAYEARRAAEDVADEEAAVVDHVSDEPADPGDPRSDGR